MHVHFEETLTHSDCVIQALSWMGKVPDILPEEDGWKLNRNNYYQVECMLPCVRNELGRELCRYSREICDVINDTL